MSVKSTSKRKKRNQTSNVTPTSENTEKVPFKDLQELRVKLQKAFTKSKMYAEDSTSKRFTRRDIDTVVTNIIGYDNFLGYSVPQNMMRSQYVTNSNFEPSSNSNNGAGYDYRPHPSRDGVYRIKNTYANSYNSGSYIQFFRKEFVTVFLKEVFAIDGQWTLKSVTQQITHRNINNEDTRDDTFKIVICHRTYSSAPPCIFYIRHVVERPFINVQQPKRKRVKTERVDEYRHHFYVSAFTVPLIPEKYVLIVPTSSLEKRRIQNFKFESITYQIHYKTKIGQSNDTLRNRMHFVLNTFYLDRKKVTYIRRIDEIGRAHV